MKNKFREEYNILYSGLKKEENKIKYMVDSLGNKLDFMDQNTLLERNTVLKGGNNKKKQKRKSLIIL